MVIFEHTVPLWIIWTGASASAILLVLSAWRYLAWDWVSITLTALRLVFIAVFAWCLFQPEYRRSITHMLKPRFVVALDTSRSMLLTPSDDVSNRWSRARGVLNDGWTTAVGAECEIDTYPFASDVGARLGLGEATALNPQGDATYLRESLHKLTDRYKGQNVVGMLLLSDGIDTREALHDWVYESWPCPIYTVRLEPEAAWQVEADVRVDSVNTPRRVNVGWSTELKAVVSGQGTGGQAVNVQLLKDGVLIQETPIQLPEEGGARDVTFQLDHPEIGVATYKVQIPPFPDESHTNDNFYATSIQVIDARNRLLYVEGVPRFESKYLSQALRANPQITPLIFIRGPHGGFLTIGSRGTMTTDMTPSQLAFFKIVIVGNLDAEGLGKERAANLVQFVDTGGSLVLLGGSKAWGASGFSQTPLRRILPVKEHGTVTIEQKVPVTLTDAGRNHPAFAGDESLWEILPPILSYFSDVVVAPGAETLLTVSTEEGPQPLVVAQRYGQGKVVAIFTDSLWKWRLSAVATDAKPYTRFWNQLLTWLTPAEEEVGPEKPQLFADKEQIFLGEEIEISARLPEKLAERAGNAPVSAEITTPDERRVPFAMSSQHVVTPSGKSFPGYAMTFTAEHPGLHTAVAVVEVDGEDVHSDPISFFVKPFTPESMPRPADTEVLEGLARSSGGAYFEDTTSLAEHLASLRAAGVEEESVEYESLWRNLLMITCLMTLLTIEWAVRKWRNMP